jgi:hypothetical protein
MKKTLYLIPLLFFFIIPSFAHASDNFTFGQNYTDNYGYNAGGSAPTLSGTYTIVCSNTSAYWVYALAGYPIGTISVSGDVGTITFTSSYNSTGDDFSLIDSGLLNYESCGSTINLVHPPVFSPPVFITVASSTCQYYATSTPSGSTFITLANSTCQSSSTPDNINSSTSSPLFVFSQDNGDLLFGLGLIVFILSVFFTGYLLNQFKYHDTH